jgi:hypothetical protein
MGKNRNRHRQSARRRSHHIVIIYTHGQLRRAQAWLRGCPAITRRAQREPLDPVKIIEHPSYENAGITLACRQAIVDRKAVACNQMRDDRIAVANGRIAVQKIGQLTTRGVLRIDDVLMPEGKLAQLQKSIDL